MLKSLRIRNYRVFKDLKVDGLQRINLIAGKNNSGKTSLLEAVFLLAQGRLPQVAATSSILRGPISSVQQTPQSPELAQTLAHRHMATSWRHLYHSMETERPIVIRGGLDSSPAEASSDKAVCLSIELKRALVTHMPRDAAGALPTIAPEELHLVFRQTDAIGCETEGKISLTLQGIQFDSPKADILFNAVMVSPRSRDDVEDAEVLSRLRVRKADSVVLGALQMIEPKLQSLEVSAANGVPTIWGDVGKPELMPLYVMGEGMVRVARIVLAMSEARGGIVLVEEIESGIHHSVMTKVWKVIGRAAEQFDTQIFATTHSYECFENAVNALGADGFRFIRPRKTRDGGNEAVVYSSEMIDVAVRHYMEVR